MSRFLFLLCYAHDYYGDDNDDEYGDDGDDGGGGSDDDVHLEGEAGVDLLEFAFARIRDVEFDLLPSWLIIIVMVDCPFYD